jgi:hypothetical protein
MKYKIEYVKQIPHAPSYVGMNSLAAHELKIPFKHKHPEHTIVVVKNNSKKSTIAHEESEEYLMKVKHLHYKSANSKSSAHHWALQYEKLHKSFSIQRLKKLLKDKKCR